MYQDEIDRQAEIIRKRLEEQRGAKFPTQEELEANRAKNNVYKTTYYDDLSKEQKKQLKKQLKAQKKQLRKEQKQDSISDKKPYSFFCNGWRHPFSFATYHFFYGILMFLIMGTLTYLFAYEENFGVVGTVAYAFCFVYTIALLLGLFYKLMYRFILFELFRRFSNAFLGKKHYLFDPETGKMSYDSPKNFILYGIFGRIAFWMILLFAFSYLCYHPAEHGYSIARMEYNVGDIIVTKDNETKAFSKATILQKDAIKDSDSFRYLVQTDTGKTYEACEYSFYVPDSHDVVGEWKYQDNGYIPAILSRYDATLHSLYYWSLQCIYSVKETREQIIMSINEVREKNEGYVTLGQ